MSSEDNGMHSPESPKTKKIMTKFVIIFSSSDLTMPDKQYENKHFDQLVLLFTFNWHMHFSDYSIFREEPRIFVVTYKLSFPLEAVGTWKCHMYCQFQ